MLSRTFAIDVPLTLAQLQAAQTKTLAGEETDLVIDCSLMINVEKRDPGQKVPIRTIKIINVRPEEGKVVFSGTVGKSVITFADENVQGWTDQSYGGELTVHNEDYLNP